MTNTGCSDGVFDHKSYTEKALNRLAKSRAKAERAAARQAAAVSSALGESSSNLTQGIAEDVPSLDTGIESLPLPDSDEVPPAVPPKESAPDRTELLRSHPEVVGRFLHLMVPILVDVYAASVITPVRIKTLTGLLKAVSFLDGEELKEVFKVKLEDLTMFS